MKAVVDSCGWIEFIGNGVNASFFEAALLDERNLFVPPVVIFEVTKRMLVLEQTSAIQAVLSVMERCQRAELSAAQMYSAAQASKLYKIAMADAIIWQTAQVHSAMLYTQDIDLKGLPSVKFKAKA
jgi:predicted nucleic acid-binding protein